MELLELEAAIRQLPGVLGCVIVPGPHGEPSEIQAFSGAGVSKDDIQRAILAEVDRRGLADALQRMFVFELETEYLVGGEDSLKQVALLAEFKDLSERPVAPALDAIPSAGNRPAIRRVVFSSTKWSAEAEVSLATGETEATGRAAGEKTIHALNVFAEATLKAVELLLGRSEFRFRDASLVTAVGRDLVIVAVTSGDLDLVGTAVVGEGPAGEPAVRATLDAVNRRLALMG